MQAYKIFNKKAEQHILIIVIRKCLEEIKTNYLT